MNPFVIASEAKQSSLLRKERSWIASSQVLLAMTAVGATTVRTYSITACSAATDCLRSVALLDPIMMVSGIAHSVKISSIW